VNVRVLRGGEAIIIPSYSVRQNNTIFERFVFASGESPPAPRVKDLKSTKTRIMVFP
jgi:hypothetical protein